MQLSLCRVSLGSVAFFEANLKLSRNDGTSVLRDLEI